MSAGPLAALVGIAMLAGCGGGDRPRAARVARADSDWHRVATDADRERLRNWRAAWVSAVGQVRAAGRGDVLAPLGALFEPDRALPDPLPPPGAYRCRTFKLGAKMMGMAAYTAYPWFDCRIDRDGQDLLNLSKMTGSQRPVGQIFRDGDARGVFLGTLALGDETGPLRYGQDRTRDMAGIVERVGERRWRVMLPYPAFESTMDVIELVPAGQGRR